jgi:hypothetical protein
MAGCDDCRRMSTPAAGSQTLVACSIRPSFVVKHNGMSKKPPGGVTLRTSARQGALKVRWCEQTLGVRKHETICRQHALHV